MLAFFPLLYSRPMSISLKLPILSSLLLLLPVRPVHPSFHRTRPDDPEDEHCGWIFKDPSDSPLPNSKVRS